MKTKFLKKVSAEDFNAKYPVGTAVRYFPLVKYAEFIESKTRTPAWTLGHGTVVVSIEGKAGGLSLEHIQIVQPE